MRARARSRYKALDIYPGAGARCKKRDKLIYFTSVVSGSGCYHDSYQGAGFIMKQEPSQGIKKAQKVYCHDKQA